MWNSEGMTVKDPCWCASLLVLVSQMYDCLAACASTFVLNKVLLELLRCEVRIWLVLAVSYGMAGAPHPSPSREEEQHPPLSPPPRECYLGHGSVPALTTTP